MFSFSFFFFWTKDGCRHILILFSSSSHLEIIRSLGRVCSLFGILLDSNHFFSVIFWKGGKIQTSNYVREQVEQDNIFIIFKIGQVNPGFIEVKSESTVGIHIKRFENCIQIELNSTMNATEWISISFCSMFLCFHSFPISLVFVFSIFVFFFCLLLNAVREDLLCVHWKCMFVSMSTWKTNDTCILCKWGRVQRNDIKHTLTHTAERYYRVEIVQAK